MIGFRKAGLIVATAMTTFGSRATAQTPKELKMQSGKSVVVVNLLSTRPDCSSNPGPISVPVLREKPTNGIIQMQITGDQRSSGRKLPGPKDSFRRFDLHAKEGFYRNGYSSS